MRDRRGATVASIVSTREPIPVVLGQREADARIEARRIVEAARDEARRIEAAAVERIELARREGWRVGRAEGIARQLEETARMLDRLDAHVRELESRYASLVTACAERVLERELSIHPDAVVDVVRAATRDLRWATDLRIHAHPDDVEAIRGRRLELRSELRPNASIRIVEDPDVGRGGCVIASDLGTIDATIETQLRALDVVFSDRA